MSKHIGLNPELLSEIQALPDGQALQLINLLRFKENDGESSYMNYMIAAKPFFEQVNAKIIYSSYPQLFLAGPADEKWDRVLIVEYASKDDFLSMITMKDYPIEMRTASLQDSRLILCTSNKIE